MSESIAEVIVNENVEISIEMVEEYEAFIADKFSQNFGLLINKVHAYTYAFEAKLSIGSQANLKAIAVVNYNEKSELFTEEFVKLRSIDGWNLQAFSGLNLGYPQALDWLKKELSAISG